MEIFFSSTAWFNIYILGMIFIFGAIIGSFLNVVIYRFHTGKSINGSSHCMSCLRRLRWFELFPLVSYVLLRGKCRTCRSNIPPRYFVVEFITALAFLSIYKHGGSFEMMFLYGLLFATLMVIAVYDLYHYIIPDELVILTGVIVLAFFGFFIYTGAGFTILVPAVLSAVASFAFYGGLWKMSSGRWLGFGDVKLSVPLAFLVGYPGVFSMIVLSFWVGAVVSLFLLGLQEVMKRGQIPLRIFGSPLKMKSEIPFAPFLITGFVLNYFYGVDVLTLMSYVI